VTIKLPQDTSAAVIIINNNDRDATSSRSTPASATNASSSSVSARRGPYRLLCRIDDTHGKRTVRSDRDRDDMHAVTAPFRGCGRAVVETYLPMLPQMMGWK